MTTSNRHPSRDKPNPEECPFCEGDNILVTPGPFYECQECGAEVYGSDWSKAIRRSEVAELLRLVDGLRSSVNTGSPEWYAAYATLMTYADKLRKEWKL